MDSERARAARTSPEFSGSAEARSLAGLIDVLDRAEGTAGARRVAVRRPAAHRPAGSRAGGVRL